MPRHTAATRATTTDARVSALEAAFVSIPALIAKNVNSLVNATMAAVIDSQLSGQLATQLGQQLPIYFEQFRCELTARSEGERSSAPGNSDHPPPHDRDPIHFPFGLNGLGEGGPSPRPVWSPRVDFPYFTEGDDPLAWIYKVNQFFAFYHKSENQKVFTASFHLKGEPLQWFQWMDCTRSTPHWEDFTRAFCREFGPSEFDDSAESLFKLRQTCILREYISEFRRLANHTSDLGPILLKSFFLGGLKCELKYDVKLLKPANVHEAIAIATQLDTKLAELKLPSSQALFAVKPIVATPLITLYLGQLTYPSRN